MENMKSETNRVIAMKLFPDSWVDRLMLECVLELNDVPNMDFKSPIFQTKSEMEFYLEKKGIHIEKTDSGIKVSQDGQTVPNG